MTTQRAGLTELMVLLHLERADAALAAGETVVARRAVAHALHAMQHVKAAQDVVLDEAARTPEQRAPRETPPMHPGEQR